MFQHAWKQSYVLKIALHSYYMVIAFDVVKTRMQGMKASRYKGTADCVTQMMRHEGIGAFYAGVLPRLGTCDQGWL